MVVRDADPTTPFGSLVDGTDFKRKDWNNVSTGTSAALTTAVDECLLLYSWNADGNTVYMKCKINEATGLD